MKLKEKLKIMFSQRAQLEALSSTNESYVVYNLKFINSYNKVKKISNSIFDNPGFYELFFLFLVSVILLSASYHYFIMWFGLTAFITTLVLGFFLIIISFIFDYISAFQANNSYIENEYISMLQRELIILSIDNDNLAPKKIKERL